MSDDGDLRTRLESLLAEARDAGRADELKPLLSDFLRAPAAEGAAAPADSDVPLRFGMVGASAGMRSVFDLIERVAPSGLSVLVQGETGTGKELVARAIHEHSPRARGPFLAENCSAVPANLLESELFGHKKGSFTGAVADRDGHFKAADGGTLFLDEIGDMPLEMQAKLLRALEAGEIRPVGSSRTLHVDVRVVAATHRDLFAMSAEKAFREDLFYRLNVVRIELPPLRERRDDIPHLVHFFLAEIGREMGRASGEVSQEALDTLTAWDWPGNVRQLENEIRRAMALSSGMIERNSLSPAIVPG